MKGAGSSYDELVALRSKTVFERATLLAASGDRSRLDMTAAHVLSLLERFPPSTGRRGPRPRTRPGPSRGMVSTSATAGSASLIGCPRSWLSISQNHIDQLKEKWGRLTVYFEREESVPRDLSLDAEMDAAIDQAEEESERTCLVCGEPGTIARRDVGSRCCAGRACRFLRLRRLAGVSQSGWRAWTWQRSPRTR